MLSVSKLASTNAAKLSKYWTGDAQQLLSSVEAAALAHDCGKLAPENQAVLLRSSSEKLPKPHEDAGIALLLEHQLDFAAMLVASHHKGLPSSAAETQKMFEDPPGKKYRSAAMLNHTAAHMAAYKAEYMSAGIANFGVPRERWNSWSGLTARLALSCLVDADHSDTAMHYGASPPPDASPTQWRKRIEALDRYVARLAEKIGPRTAQREHVYRECSTASFGTAIRSCTAAVGSGKTTAVMAYLLRIAAERQLRHIFVILPFVNLIRQSVAEYRKALVLEGEDPLAIVAELHHQADFAALDARGFASLWKAPVIVTTAVQFFETLAGNMPGQLRKIHELPGSAIFIDEAHAAIPIWLWPQTWLWLKELASDWACHFVLSSGSLIRFWELPGVIKSSDEVCDLILSSTSEKLQDAESQRVSIGVHDRVLDCKGLIDFIRSNLVPDRGPCLVILNTVQSAAVLADTMRSLQIDVEHLSTALTPIDREIKELSIRNRLKNPADRAWALVATSCVEAGVDFSFGSAIREACSVASVIQTGGRVNRHLENQSPCPVWMVKLSDPTFNEHPAFAASRRVLDEMIGDGWLLDPQRTPSAKVTEALRRELVLKDVSERAQRLVTKERIEEYPDVAEMYRVIEADTRIVVVDANMIRRLVEREKVSNREVLRHSVQLWATKISELRLEPLPSHTELYRWSLEYDSFLGYMKGLLPLLKAKQISAHFI